MKITECYLYNFGRFKNFKISFKDGLNCISADNGYGKTTVCDFIRIMLYGMRDTKKLGIIDNDRRHYLPWSKETCRGSLTFCTEGGKYRIERSFGGKASEDTLAVYDVSCELITDRFGSVPGKSILGIDSDTFERTLYISDRGYTAGSESRAINEILTGAPGAETATIDRALKNLDEERKIYQKRGGGGEIAETRCAITELDLEIKSTENKLQDLDGMRKDLTVLNERIADTKRQISYSRSDYERVRLSEIRRTFGRTDSELLSSIEKDEAKILEISEFFGGNVPTLADIEAMKAENSKKAIDQDKDGFFSKRVPTDEEISRMKEAAGACEDGKKGKSLKAPVFFLGAVMLILGALLGVCVLPALYLVALLGVGMMVFALTLTSKKRGTNADEVQEFTEDFPCPSGLSPLEACSLIEEKYKQYQAMHNEGDANSDSKNTYIAEAQGKVLEYMYLTDSLKRKKQELDALRESYKMSDAYSYRTTLTEDDVKRREGELSDTLSALESERALLTQAVEAAEKLIPRLKDLTEERSALAEKLASAEKKLEIILKTQEFLIETSNSLATEQLGATNRKFKGYLGAIDPTYISDTNLNISFEAARQEMGSTHPAESYSKGTRDLFEISTKLAISDSAFGNEKPFILLDDPFVYFDDGKLESAKRLLYSLSKDRQVLYFTASKFRGI